VELATVALDAEPNRWQREIDRGYEVAGCITDHVLPDHAGQPV